MQAEFFKNTKLYFVVIPERHIFIFIFYLPKQIVKIKNATKRRIQTQTISDTTCKIVEDKAFDHMKKHLFIFLINKIRSGKDDLDTIQYYSFVKNYKTTFVSKYNSENNISNPNLLQ